jgi:hypothetical protein
MAFLTVVFVVGVKLAVEGRAVVQLSLHKSFIAQTKYFQTM